jgi:putative membrane protein
MAAVNAVLNASSAVLLLAGRRRIAKGDVAGHRRLMLAAVGTSSAFLVSYLVYHALTGSRRYPGEGALRTVYLGVLLSHTVLAASLAWLVPRTVFLGLRDRRAEHVRIARWAYPIWLYVSVTGVVVYLMLYPFAPVASPQ